ncbi:MAG TPA: YdiU family protein [Burkholderiaceae bacterium]|nr:YdiU family protein [Burkholderiaceae bacterium]
MSETLVRSSFSFDNSYALELSELAVPWQPAKVPAPAMLFFNRELAVELRLDAEALDGKRGAAIFSGNEVPEGATPIAQAYAGHQFGGFSPSLGDGRALLLGEVIDRNGNRRDVAFKGSGRTPFSRGGDGKAAVGPVLREAIIGEAMHALGIPTTRALAAVATGEPVFREDVLPGAVLTRVAASHLRVGTFQYFAARGQIDKLRKLADYAIARHDPALANHPDRYLALLRAVAERQAGLVARWMHVGFIHGVMNTDNMTISGETIDYGPCAFMEAWNPEAVFSSIDTHGRYAYANQPLIARWNLARLAESLLPLMDPEQPERAVPRATEVIDEFPADYERHWLDGARAKMGLPREDAGDEALARDWLAILQAQSIDHTLAWRYLADAAEGEGLRLQALFEDTKPLADWLIRWRQRAAGEASTAGERAQSMRRVNPIYIPRNLRVEEALEAASADSDLGPFTRLLEVLAQPFEERPGLERYARPAAPEVTAGYRTFCGT